jgi:hypothetical protein
MKIDEKEINSNILENLIELIKPIHTESKKEEKIETAKKNRELLVEYKKKDDSNLSLIGKTERFQYMIMEIPNLQRKLNIFKFKHEYESILDRINDDIEYLSLS